MWEYTDCCEGQVSVSPIGRIFAMMTAKDTYNMHLRTLFVRHIMSHISP